MIVVTDPSDLPRIANLAIRKLVALRLQQLSLLSDFDSAPVELIVVEANDQISEIEEEIGIPILTSLFDDIPYGHDDYVPPTEAIERRCCHETGNTTFEMYVCLTNDGAGSVVFVPDEKGTDARLLSMLRKFSTSAVSTP